MILAEVMVIHIPNVAFEVDLLLYKENSQYTLWINIKLYLITNLGKE